MSTRWNLKKYLPVLAGFGRFGRLLAGYEITLEPLFKPFFGHWPVLAGAVTRHSLGGVVVYPPCWLTSSNLCQVRVLVLSSS